MRGIFIAGRTDLRSAYCTEEAAGEYCCAGLTQAGAMFEKPVFLMLPEHMHTMTSDVIRRYVRRLEGQQHSGELCIWEGEGGKLVSAPAHRRLPGPLSRFMPT